ncbi:type IV secretion system protein VirB10 [Nitrospirillum amazonense]|uniref:Type IV secretion system protein VirB10 n=1 Tax=Nitrospirillum amazonense TaxID=28077 RepID=A0A560FPA5_9PROT|nr:TrbI/VirB10 family protein [Nitrospirillum amazonense]TWB23435.1 type IV secretion system protein VirB10 [Nitrospirillum amazonense]
MDPTPEPPTKADPAAFALRARPRPVTRLSRRTLGIASAVLALLVVVALWWALTWKPPKLTADQQLYATEVKPDDSLTAPPPGYADLTRHPAVPPASQPLPPPSPMPAFTSPGGPANSAAQERNRQRQQAAASPVFFTVTAHAAGPLLEAKEEPGQGAAVAAGEEAEDNDPNQQAHKRAFLHGPADTMTVAAHRLQPPASPYVIQAGTVLAAALVTGLNSDLPGQVTAQVTENIYDSVTGRFLLIPQGARLLGTYDSAVTYGQSRILVVWTRLLLPNGKSLVLDRLPATDTEGHAGLEDEVDYHTGRLLRGMVLSTLLGVSGELASNGDTQTNGGGNVVVAVRQSGDNAANQVGQRLAAKDLGVQPTLTDRPGLPLRVLVNRDLMLEPYSQK